MRYCGYDGVEPIRDYAEAVQREASIKPIRGNSNGAKPLGERRKWHWCGIKKVGDTIACHHNGTNTTFHPDGTIKLTFKYVGQNTQKQVASILGVSCKRVHSRVWVNSTFDNGEGALVDGFLPVGQRRNKEPTEVTFSRVEGTGKLLCLNPSFPTVRKLNLPLFNTLFKPFKPFLKYAVGMTKLHQDGFVIAEARESALLEYPELAEHAMSEDPDKMHTAFMSIVANEAYKHWGDRITVSPNKVRKYVQEAVFRNNASDALFIPIEVRTGRIVQDVYGKYKKA
jgi:hypothetical protein